MENGLVGRLGLPEKVRREQRALARAEAEHFVALMEDEPIGVQIGIVPDTLPHASFQIFRQPDRQVLALSPFRLGEQPNIRVGVAMITSAPEALACMRRWRRTWQRALKGGAAGHDAIADGANARVRSSPRETTFSRVIVGSREELDPTYELMD